MKSTKRHLHQQHWALHTTRLINSFVRQNTAQLCQAGCCHVQTSANSCICLTVVFFCGRRLVRQNFVDREARRQAEVRAEVDSGETGVFALVNQHLGDNSEAAKIQRRSLEGRAGSMQPRGGSKLLQAAPQDRKSLVASQVT